VEKGNGNVHDYLVTAFALSAIAVADTAQTLDLAQFGPFAAAIAIAWFLLLRSDRQLSNERADSKQDIVDARDEARSEIERLTLMLEKERLEHQQTRKTLIEHLRKEHDPD
jgi:hypothetical protein